MVNIESNNPEGILDAFTPTVSIALPEFFLDEGLFELIDETYFSPLSIGEPVNIHESLLVDVSWLLGQPDDLVDCPLEAVHQVVRLRDPVMKAVHELLPDLDLLYQVSGEVVEGRLRQVPLYYGRFDRNYHLSVLVEGNHTDLPTVPSEDDLVILREVYFLDFPAALQLVLYHQVFDCQLFLI